MAVVPEWAMACCSTSSCCCMGCLSGCRRYCIPLGHAGLLQASQGARGCQLGAGWSGSPTVQIVLSSCWPAWLLGLGEGGTIPVCPSAAGSP